MQGNYNNVCIITSNNQPWYLHFAAWTQLHSYHTNNKSNVDCWLIRTDTEDDHKMAAMYWI